MKFKINKNVLIQESGDSQPGHIRRNAGKYTAAGLAGAGAVAYNNSPEARDQMNAIASKGKDLVNQGIDNSQTLSGLKQSIQNYSDRAGTQGGDLKNIQISANALMNNPAQPEPQPVQAAPQPEPQPVQAPSTVPAPSTLNMIQKTTSGNDTAQNVVNNNQSEPTNSISKGVDSNPGSDIDQTLRNIQNKNMSTSDQLLHNVANKSSTTESPVQTESPVASNPGFDPASLPNNNVPVDDKTSAINMLLKGQSQMPTARQNEIHNEAYLQRQADEIMGRVPSNRQYYKEPSLGEEIDNVSNKFGNIKKALGERLSDFTN